MSRDEPNLKYSRVNTDSDFCLFFSTAPRSGLAVKHFIDVGGEFLKSKSRVQNQRSS